MGSTLPSSSSLVVNRGFPNPGYVWSPFVTKVEFRLRHSSLPHTVECNPLSAAPKGKIPWIQFTSPDGTINSLGDSTLIIKELVSSGSLLDLNSRLQAGDRLFDLGVRSLLEDKLYFYHTRERWLDNYYDMRDHILCALPYPMRLAIGYIIYRKQISMLHGQGTLRFELSELVSLREEIWHSISDTLLVSRRNSANSMGSKDEAMANGCFYLLGRAEPTEADFVLFGFITSVLICTACPESNALVRQYDVLLDYVGRIHDKYFPDYDRWEL